VCQCFVPSYDVSQKSHLRFASRSKGTGRQVSRSLRLCASLGCLRILWKSSLLRIISCLEPWLICRRFSTWSVVILLLFRMMARSRAVFSVVDADCRPGLSTPYICTPFFKRVSQFLPTSLH
jgi:hypothetical protein